MRSANDEYFMNVAFDLAASTVDRGIGNPFGAVVVLNNEIIGYGQNQTLSTPDPTAHAEIVAIRDACKQLGNKRLTNSVIYTTCEPCPMCLGAIYWSRISQIVYASTRNDAANIGFDDQLIYDECCLPLSCRKIPIRQSMHQRGQELFSKWISR